jgi:hypothetical protein
VSDERPEAFMMIGLHKLAAQNGDGLVPELYALLTRRADMLESGNVAEFPLHSARRPARVAAFEGAAVHPEDKGALEARNDPALEARNDNVVAFPVPHVARRELL